MQLCTIPSVTVLITTLSSHKHLYALRVLPLAHFHSSCQAVTFPSTHHSQPFLCFWQTNKIRKLQLPNYPPIQLTEPFCLWTISFSCFSCENKTGQKLLGFCESCNWDVYWRFWYLSPSIQAHYCCILQPVHTHSVWKSRDWGGRLKVETSL